MNKRYQIFVSSTFSDLKEERQAVMQALLSLDLFPAGMELFPASDEDQLALIQGVIDDSDYYILVIGGRYGSTNEEGISYTEMEFDYALKKKKPILAFIHNDPNVIASGKTDQNDKMRAALHTFKKKVETGRHVKYWSNADDLQAKVIQSISAEIKRNPQEGWIRASFATDPTILESLRQEIDRLTADLERNRQEAPKGTEAYAGGTDTYEITRTYSLSFKPYAHTVKASWDEIFAEVGPVMMEEATERQMKERLAQIHLQEIPSGARPVSISDDSFDTVKIQLLALGLIRRSTRKHVPSDTNRYWSLTSYGEITLMKLRAILKQKAQAEPILD